MGKVLKGVGKLFGVDMDGAKKAANAQAKATTDASNRVASDNLLQAQAAQQQIEATQAQNAARAKQNDLLGRPLDTADVDLGDNAADTEDDLLRSKRATRQSYRSATGSGNSGLML